LRLSSLDRKLLRDLWKMRGQALAIALVIAAGVTMFVTYLSNFDSLRRTQEAYYDRQRFADVFASLKRAPQRLDGRIAAIPGVAAVDTRVVAAVTLDVPDLDEPARGILIGLPAVGQPRLNAPVLRRGRWIDPRRPDEILASEAFGTAHRFEPGATVAAIINGRRRNLTIVGFALSPEYVYSMPPGELMPDDRRFGVFWMERRALAAAFDMEGGFNDVSVQLMPEASSREVITRLDRLLVPYGGLGAIPRALQFSHWVLNSELTQLQTFGFIIPALFFGVAAFILNIALTRALALQRPQIASLKALGYTNLEIGWHYLKWALAIASLGTILGIGTGAWMGGAMIQLYNQYFRFPSLEFLLSSGTTVGAAVMSLGMAALGAVFSVRRAVRIAPAEAMRPEPPVRYRTSLAERAFLQGRLTHATRMILRNLERQPLRVLASVTGIGFAMTILMTGFVMIDVMDLFKDIQFSFVQRQDVSVTFVEPVSARALHELKALPGVVHVESMRAVPARLRFGHRHRNVSVTGLPQEPSLNRIVDRSGEVVSLPPDGIVVSQKLAEVLGLSVGQTVLLELLEGARPTRSAVVARLVDDYLGLSVSMEREALHRLMREGGSLSGAYLQVDAVHMKALYRRLKHTPAVGGVALTAAALRSFEETMAQNMDFMIFLNVVFAGIIAFGVVYNAARISLSERSHELASLRVLGFTRAEISLILLGELAVTAILALPVGALMGFGFSKWMLTAIESEVYRFPLVATPRSAAISALIVLAAVAFSGLAVRRKLDKLDLIAVLKTRE